MGSLKGQSTHPKFASHVAKHSWNMVPIVILERDVVETRQRVNIKVPVHNYEGSLHPKACCGTFCASEHLSHINFDNSAVYDSLRPISSFTSVDTIKFGVRPV